jgi:hypothetical protein
VAKEKLKLRYVPLSQAKLWDDNPKLHDIGALMRSIQLHGFGDPPKYDAKLEGLVYGNGRTEALVRMREEGMAPPRGVVALEDDEDWAVPIIFGVDAASRAAAVAFAIDHNNLGLLGGNLGFTDLLALWDEEGLQKVLADVPDAGALLASLDSDDIAALLTGPNFQPAGADDQSRLDEKRGDPVTCPKCGVSFVPER